MSQRRDYSRPPTGKQSLGEARPTRRKELHAGEAELLPQLIAKLKADPEGLWPLPPKMVPAPPRLPSSVDWVPKLALHLDAGVASPVLATRRLGFPTAVHPCSDSALGTGPSTRPLGLPWCLSRRRSMAVVQVIAGDVDATLVRFLRARKGKVPDAAQMLKGEARPTVLCCALQGSRGS